jgi:branched-chain amino acid transport system ATP-binding protein
MSALLEIDNLSLRFGGVRAVQGLSFTVNEREILGLIGPNGAGKSTVFNLIDGIYPPDEGRVIFAGRDITGEKPYRVVRHGIARTHQIVQPLVGMSVLENCMVGACFGFQNQSLRRGRETAREVLSLVGLADRADSPASQLTIAGKKRLELARALCASPMLLLLDEVLAGLNPSEVERMIEMIRGIRERGVAILMIEHLMQAIMSLSDRIVVLNTGQKLAEGLPAEVAHNKSVIEAYLGDPNMVAKLGADRNGTDQPGAAP